MTKLDEKRDELAKELAGEPSKQNIIITEERIVYLIYEASKISWDAAVREMQPEIDKQRKKLDQWEKEDVHEAMDCHASNEKWKIAKKEIERLEDIVHDEFCGLHHHHRLCKKSNEALEKIK